MKTKQKILMSMPRIYGFDDWVEVANSLQLTQIKKIVLEAMELYASQQVEGKDAAIERLKKELQEMKTSNGRGWRGVERLTARVKELEDATRWIPVIERLPEIVDEYNVVWNFAPDRPIVTTMEFDSKNKKWIDTSGFVDSDCTDEVSAWQPLPKPPKQFLNPPYIEGKTDLQNEG